MFKTFLVKYIYNQIIFTFSLKYCMIYALFHQGEVTKAVTLMGAKPFVLTMLPHVTNTD